MLPGYEGKGRGRHLLLVRLMGRFLEHHVLILLSFDGSRAGCCMLGVKHYKRVADPIIRGVVVNSNAFRNANPLVTSRKPIALVYAHLALRE